MKRYLVALTLCLACVAPAAAYVGPGPGLSMIGSFFTLVAGVGLALLMILIYPARLLLKRRKAAESQEKSSKE